MGTAFGKKGCILDRLIQRDNIYIYKQKTPDSKMSHSIYSLFPEYTSNDTLRLEATKLNVRVND